MQDFFTGGTSMGTSLGIGKAVAAFRGVVAVGTSSSIVGVLMPRGLSADGHPSGSTPNPTLHHAHVDAALTRL